MHKVTVTEAFDMGKPFGVLEPGEWIMHDQNAWECGLIAKRGTVSVEKYENLGTAQRRGKMLLMRSGAYGDLLFMGPAIRAYREAYPEMKIHLSCFDIRKPLFDGTELFHELEPYPFPAERADEFDVIISLENIIELEREEHATDAFAKRLGVAVTDYKPIYALTRQEALTAMTRVVHGRPKLGLQLRASTANRDYPADRWLKVIATLEARGWEIFLFGTKAQISGFPPEKFRSPHIHNLGDADYTFRESAAILAQMDAFCGVDSVWLHMCHALDIPAIGLFGPIPWKLRTSKAPKTQVLTGLAECAPCFHHVHAGSHFPRNMPCAKTQRCVAMGEIDPMRIVAKVDALKPALR